MSLHLILNIIAGDQEPTLSPLKASSYKAVPKHSRPQCNPTSRSVEGRVCIDLTVERLFPIDLYIST